VKPAQPATADRRRKIPKPNFGVKADNRTRIELFRVSAIHEKCPNVGFDPELGRLEIVVTKKKAAVSSGFFVGYQKL